MPPRPEQEPKTPAVMGEVLQQHNLDSSVLDDSVSAGFHIGFIKNKDGEIEYTKPLPSIHTAKNKYKLEDFISQADPVRISPTRRKPAQRDHKRIFAFGDSQIDYRQINGELVPTHDERALTIVRMMCAHLQPDEIVNLGDTIDLAALSHFAPDSNHFQHSMMPALNRVHQMYAELRADNPQARITEVDSNHNTRLGKFVLKNVPNFYLLQQAGQQGDYPVLSYPFLVNLKPLDVNWVSGYGAAEYVYGEDYGKPPIVFKHGVSVVSNGSTAARESRDNPYNHIVRGHGHRAETHHRTTKAGQQLASIMVGATCDTTGSVPSYHSAVDDKGQVVKQQENWTQSVLVIEDYNGEYQFNHVIINNGVANYQGKKFNGNI